MTCSKVPMGTTRAGGHGELAAPIERRDIQIGDGELVDARHDQAKQLPVGAFTQCGDLVVQLAEIGGGSGSLAAIQYRAGDHPLVTGTQLTGGQLVGAGAHPGPDQAWPLDAGAGKCHDPVKKQLASGKQVADGDEVLVVDLPDSPVGADRH